MSGPALNRHNLGENEKLRAAMGPVAIRNEETGSMKRTAMKSCHPIPRDCSQVNVTCALAVFSQKGMIVVSAQKPRARTVVPGVTAVKGRAK